MSLSITYEIQHIKAESTISGQPELTSKIVGTGRIALPMFDHTAREQIIRVVKVEGKVLYIGEKSVHAMNKVTDDLKRRFSFRVGDGVLRKKKSIIIKALDCAVPRPYKQTKKGQRVTDFPLAVAAELALLYRIKGKSWPRIQSSLAISNDYLSEARLAAGQLWAVVVTL